MAETRIVDPTREEVDIFTLQALANETPNLISLGLGDPDSPTPAHIVQAAKQAIDEGHTGPAPTRGLIELRRAIAAKLERENGITVDPEREVLVTTGSQEALFLLVQALIDPGDEVLVPDPRYPAYDAAINLAGGRIVLVPTTQEKDFALRAEDIEACLTERSKALLLISPSNPTAAVIPPDEIRRIAALAIERDLIVISDEIYEHFLYDGAEHLSIGSLPGMQERTITLNGLSKAYAMTGWRVGYIAAPAEFISAVASLKAMINVHAPTVSQWAAVAALEGPQDCVQEMRKLYAHRRRVLMDGLKEMGFSFGSSQGAFYIWANTSSTGLDAMRLSYLWLRDAGVMVFPGTGFGERWKDYMRFTLLQPDDVMLQALERMDEALKTG
jgi:aminotransferase